MLRPKIAFLPKSPLLPELPDAFVVSPGEESDMLGFLFKMRDLHEEDLTSFCKATQTVLNSAPKEGGYTVRVNILTKIGFDDSVLHSISPAEATALYNKDTRISINTQCVPAILSGGYIQYYFNVMIVSTSTD